VDVDKLKSVALFAGLAPSDLRRVAALTDEVRLPAGTRLLDEGTFSHEFLIISEGSADVRRGGELVAQLGPGDFAGEIGVMRDVRRSATVTAATELVAVVMTARDLRRIASELPGVGARIDAAIASRSGADVPTE
jgi:CRP/FNR family cyclic AMP-dependent transcriptional regulator